MIVVVDYGIGNILSIQNMLRKIGAKSCISNDHKVIEKASKLILPGVGSFSVGMQNLKKQGLIDVLEQKVIQQNTPILGICLGMQLMCAKSEEAGQITEGLGWFKAEVKYFDKTKLPKSLKVPHMGWSEIDVKQPDTFFSKTLDEPYRFYFTHSLHVANADLKEVLCESTYGYNFVSALKRDHIVGVQFHPEKSHFFGMELFKRFCFEKN